MHDKTFPGEVQHTGLLTSARDPMTDHSIYNTQVQFIKPVSFIGITQSNIYELYTGAELMQRQLHHQSSPPHGWQFPEAGDPGHTVSLLAMNQCGDYPSRVTHLF